MRGDIHCLHDAAGWGHQHPVQAMVEKAGKAPGGLQEIEGVAARRGVDDHEIETLVGMEVVELLHCHVLLGARQRPRDVPVEAVGQDPLGLLWLCGVAGDEIVEGAFRVEHHRPQLTGPWTVDLFGLIADSVESQRVGQPLGGIDGHHHGPPARLGRFHCQYGCDGGLADATRS